MEVPSSSLFDRNEIPDGEKTGDKGVPYRFIIPNIVTIIAIISGLSSVRMALEDRFDLAVIFLLIAAILDGIDGRLARAINGRSSFGAQMDSLADVINFGVIPAFLIYMYILKLMGNLGWLAALIYSIACCLRLARFNVAQDSTKNIPKWKQEYFVGMPSPGGGCTVLLPIYLGFLGMSINNKIAMIFCIYTVVVAFLMVCNLPVWNGKSVHSGASRSVVISAQLFILVYSFLLIEYMWPTLVASTFSYFVFLPISAWSYFRRSRSCTFKE